MLRSRTGNVVSGAALVTSPKEYTFPLMEVTSACKFRRIDPISVKVFRITKKKII